ncbi:MAG: DUF177 domain-containing protein [Clostridiales bacterium]|nr:DUF177 domain-containing protein [Clostridiales bacterium]
MVIDLKKLKLSGKTELEFFFDYEEFEDLCSLPDCEIEKPIKVLGKLEVVSDNSVIVDGEITFLLKGSCSRCLEDAEMKIVIPFSEAFDKEGDTTYEIINDKIDLSKMVDDIVIVEMPYNLLCSEDCKGLCPKCGKNLNKETCNCK